MIEDLEILLQELFIRLLVLNPVVVAKSVRKS
jgi:hypothetical protein